MSDPNEKCGICGEPRHAHLPPGETHPREARGEGRYEVVSAGYIHGGGAWYEDRHVGPTYRFVPTPERPTSWARITEEPMVASQVED